MKKGLNEKQFLKVIDSKVFLLLQVPGIMLFCEQNWNLKSQMFEYPQKVLFCGQDLNCLKQRFVNQEIRADEHESHRLYLHRLRQSCGLREW
jgi:hypothetical protein